MDKSIAARRSLPKAAFQAPLVSLFKWALMAMRTVWLALFCLIGLAITIVVKIGISPYASAAVSGGGSSTAPAKVLRESASAAAAATSSESEIIATSTPSNALTKADRLKPAYTDETKSINSVAIKPAETRQRLPDPTGRIVSRHWHDPYDNRNAAAVVLSSAKRKLAKGAKAASASPSN